jgi:hypothetical protein
MGEALARVVRERGAPENGDGLPESLLDLFAQDLLRFDREGTGLLGTIRTGLPPDLPGRLLTYVVDGADAAALGQIKLLRHQMFSYGDTESDTREPRWRIYDRWDEVPPAVMLRFAHVLASGSSAVANTPRLDLPKAQAWVEALARDLVGLPLSVETFEDGTLRPHANASFDRLAPLMALEGIAVEGVILALFTSRLGRSRPASTAFVAMLPGFGGALLTHKAAVIPVLRKASLAQKLRTVALLAATGPEGQYAFADELTELAVDSSRQVREAAWPLALASMEPEGARATELAISAKPEQRALALRLLWEYGDAQAREFVRARGDHDKAASVKDEVARLTSARPEDAAPALTLPDIRIDAAAPTSPEARGLLTAWLDKANASDEGPAWRTGVLPPVAPEVLAEIENKVEAGGRVSHVHDREIRERLWRLWHRESEAQHRGILPWLMAPGVQIIHLVRLLRLTGQIFPRLPAEWTMAYGAEAMFRKYIQNHHGSLLEVARALEAEGLPVSMLIEDWYKWGGAQWTRSLRDDAVWPFFHAYPKAIAIALPGTPTRYWWFTRERLFDALEAFPALPADLVPILAEMALGTAKSMRTGAQRVLDRYPQRMGLAVAGLAAGRGEKRIAAALWLARLKNADALKPLEQVLKAERNEAAQDAILTALEALGAPIERYLDRQELAATAAAGLKKGLPKDLLWFPLDRLPAVRWGGKGAAVAPEIVHWFLAQACRLKTPEPGALLRRYCAMFRVEDREALGAFVLSAWLAHDLVPQTREKAEQQARSNAQQTHQAMQRGPQWWQNSSLFGLSEDELFAHYLPDQLRTPAGSATSAKGVLAVAAACGGPRIAPMVADYLKTWYGYRAAQGKALIQMLAWTEHPAATQLMLSVGSRFRTKGFQEEATKQANLLAERKGWTLVELADRTIPTAGFDESAVIALDYGERKFHAQLTEALTIKLETEDGTSISTLPEPRKSEDEAKVEEAKKLLALSRKELKSIVSMQKDRFYEAMCTERRWRMDDWSRYLLQHPIVRRHCQRLVWIALEQGHVIATFRPLDDGTLTDAADGSVTLFPEAHIALAHDTNCEPSVREAWSAHFADYGVTPLFQQFGKGTYTLPDDKGEASVISDFQGHMLEAFKLRGTATKLGYQRGPTGDGGWIFNYTKRFATLGLEGCIAFSGNQLPEQNHPVALTELSFLRQFPGGDGSETISLSEVPRVLLSECWNDMRLIAASGSGFDPAWQQKVKG